MRSLVRAFFLRTPNRAKGTFRRGRSDDWGRAGRSPLFEIRGPELEDSGGDVSDGGGEVEGPDSMPDLDKS